MSTSLVVLMRQLYNDALDFDKLRRVTGAEGIGGAVAASIAGKVGANGTSVRSSVDPA
jgi:hypothetical protein